VDFQLIAIVPIYAPTNQTLISLVQHSWHVSSISSLNSWLIAPVRGAIAHHPPWPQRQLTAQLFLSVESIRKEERRKKKTSLGLFDY